MYFWKDIALARELRAGQVTEKDKFLYLMTYIYVPALFRIIADFLRGLHAGTPGAAEAMSGALGLLPFAGLAVGIWMTFHFYNVNAKGDNQHFTERYMCLALPFSLRLTANIIVISIGVGLLSVLVAITKINIAAIISPLVVGTIVFVYIFYYTFTRMTLLFKIASGQRE